MMQRKTENKFTLLKQLAVLPLLAILVMGLSNRTIKTEIITDPVTLPESSFVLQKDTATQKIIFENGAKPELEKVPVLPGSNPLSLSPDTVSDPLIIVDGRETKNMNDINPDHIESIDVLKGKSGTDLYGEKGKNGVILVTTKKESGKNTIKSELELRKFIAQHIKYPVDAQENNYQDIVELWAVVEHDGRITYFYEKQPKGNVVDVEEVVVVGYAVRKKKTTTDGEVITDEISKAEEIKDNTVLKTLLVNEVKRVSGMCPEIDIPEIKGKTIRLKVKFMLQ